MKSNNNMLLRRNNNNKYVVCNSSSNRSGLGWIEMGSPEETHIGHSLVAYHFLNGCDDMVSSPGACLGGKQKEPTVKHANVRLVSGVIRCNAKNAGESYLITSKWRPFCDRLSERCLDGGLGEIRGNSRTAPGSPRRVNPNLFYNNSSDGFISNSRN